MKKKLYEKPTTKVVVLRQQVYLLAGSNADAGSMPDYTLDNEEDYVVTQTVNVCFAEGSTTRALTAGGVKTFAEGDRIAIFYKNASNQSIRVRSDALTSSDITNGGKNAQFTFTLTNPAQNGALQIVYPYDMSNSINSGNDIDDYYTLNYSKLNNQDGNLATTLLDAMATDGMTLSGTLAKKVKISIADGATVTLDGVIISFATDYDCLWAGLTCLGDATIILKDGTTNTLKGFERTYPGLQAGPYNWTTQTTLIIKGTGTLIASSNGFGAGIGSPRNAGCGNIEIQGGVITATGGQCAAGIGCGRSGCCDDITIANTVTSVSATRGSDPYYAGNAPYSIGAGVSMDDPMSGMSSPSICGAVTFGGTKAGEGSSWGDMSWENAITDGWTNGDLTLAIAGRTWTLTSTLPKFSVSSTKKVFFSPGNLQATYNGTSWSWGFAEHQYDYIGNSVANTSITGNGTVSDNGTIDLFGWSTVSTVYGISNSESYNDYSGDFVDWGSNVIGSYAANTWRTLTGGESGEWRWLLGHNPANTNIPGTNCRTSSTVNGVENARFAHIQVNGVYGLLIFPDTYVHPAGVDAITGINEYYFQWTTLTKNYSTEDWDKMAAAGAVFLPAAGTRQGSTAKFYNKYEANKGTAFYWSSTPYSESGAYLGVSFGTTIDYWNTSTTSSTMRQYGLSVRLVRDAN